jgi:hypothetical protein
MRGDGGWRRNADRELSLNGDRGASIATIVPDRGGAGAIRLEFRASLRLASIDGRPATDDQERRVG